jgi:trigger factor
LKVEYAEESSVRKSLSFEIEAERLSEAIEERARHYSRTVKMPGFRPGKVPLGIVKSRLGRDLVMEAAEGIIQRVVPEEIAGRGLKPLAAPEVVDLQADTGKPLAFRAVFETLPLIELPDYQGIEVKARTPVVADEAVDKELERLRRQAGRYEPVENRPVEAGDHAVVDVAWKDMASGESEAREGAMLHVSPEANHPDLNATLEGMTPGETREVTLTYPGDAGQMAGKTIHYKLTLKAIKQEFLPALDDEFAKDLGDYDSLDALRKAVRERLEERERRTVEREIDEALLDALIARSSFEVPEALIAHHMTARTRGAAQDLAMAGIDPSQVGIDWRQFRDGQRDQAVRAAKAEILLDEIARREAVEVPPVEIEAELSRIAERAHSPKENVRRRLEQDGGIDALRTRIATAKTLDLLRAGARLTRE